MTENKKNTPPEWIDPDDAPDMSEGDWFERGNWYLGNKLISRGRPKLEQPKVSTTVRLDSEVIEKFRANGPGWQTRINEALREWLKLAS